MAPFGSLGRKLSRLIGRTDDRDVRSRRMVAVIECLLNQNARDAGAAVFPAMNGAVIDLCRQHDIGLLQMPCPEIACLGLARERQPGQSLREALDTEAGRACCARLAGEVVDRLQAYMRAGYQVVAALGGNQGSPGCAVHCGREGVLETSGIFMRELAAELARRQIALPLMAIRDSEPALLDQDVQALRKLITVQPPR